MVGAAAACCLIPNVHHSIDDVVNRHEVQCRCGFSKHAHGKMNRASFLSFTTNSCSAGEQSSNESVDTVEVRCPPRGAVANHDARPVHRRIDRLCGMSG